MIDNELDFSPFFLFKSPLGQTLMGWLLNIPIKLKSSTKFIELPDDDKLAMEVTTPIDWSPEDQTVIMVHGLGGSHNSVSLIRMAKKLEEKNIRSIRLNLRGCGSGKGLSKITYHCGGSDDVLEALRVIKAETPKSSITLVGFSLGGNIVLKLAGELGVDAAKYVDKVIALNPPIDMQNSVSLFETPENKVYLRYFSKLLREDIKYMREF